MSERELLSSKKDLELESLETFEEESYATAPDEEYT